MSNYHMKKLKTLGKRYARATTIAHNDALNAIAVELGFAHWKALADAAKREWQPNEGDLTRAEAFVRETGATTKGGAANHDGFLFVEPEFEEGELYGHRYQIGDSLGDVVVSGKGWDLRIPEAPLEAPIVEIDERYAETSPVNDPSFLAKLLEIAEERSKEVRTHLAVDWPRRSTKADLDGVARHPLGGGDAAKWYCHSCDAQISGVQAAANYWHCPNCGTHPFNLHAKPFDDLFSGEPIHIPDAAQREKPQVRVVEPRLTLHLDEETISTLVRCALLEDATTVNERIGAIRAQISLIDKETVWITFDEFLWPEDKDLTSVLMVAARLGLDVEQEISLFSEPFAWPDMGNMTSGTVEFLDMLLKAYEEHGVVKR